MNNFETLMWEMHNMRKVTEEGQNVSHEQRKKTAEDLINKLLSGSFMWYASSISNNHIQSHLHLLRKQRNQMDHSTSSSPGLLKHSCLQFLTIAVLESETIVETLHHLSLNSSHLA